jgi:WD40 repeat protein
MKTFWLLVILLILLAGCQSLPSPSPTSISPPTSTPASASTPTPGPTRDASTRPVISVDNADRVVELEALRGQTGPVFDVVFSPDGRMLAFSSFDGTVRLWHLATGTELATINHKPEATGLAFSPDGTLLASGGTDGAILLWEVETLAERAVLEDHAWGYTTSPSAPMGRY